MASAVTETHRRAQLALRSQTIRDLQRLWPAMGWENIDSTFPLWASAVGSLVQRGHRRSAALAAAYLRAFRASEGLPGPPVVALAPPVEPERLITVLRVTSVVSLKAAATRGVARQQAMANAFVLSSGEASRLALEGGRETIRASVAADPKAKGYERVTSGNACAFCQSRAGVPMSSEQVFQAHGSCGCSAQPIYSR